MACFIVSPEATTTLVSVSQAIHLPSYCCSIAGGMIVAMANLHWDFTVRKSRVPAHLHFNSTVAACGSQAHEEPHRARARIVFLVVRARQSDDHGIIELRVFDNLPANDKGFADRGKGFALHDEFPFLAMRGRDVLSHPEQKGLMIATRISDGPVFASRFSPVFGHRPPLRVGSTKKPRTAGPAALP